MKEEYDFSKGERGKFYKPDLELRMPGSLQKDVSDFFQGLAPEKGPAVETVVNDQLRHQPRRKDEVALLRGEA